MSYYQRHVFFCCNKREPPEKCCADAGARGDAEIREGTRQGARPSGKGHVRVNKAGCLDRCEEGPCIVVYPEAIWYTYVDRHDIDEIIDSHVVGGKIVDRLVI